MHSAPHAIKSFNLSDGHRKWRREVTKVVSYEKTAFDTLLMSYKVE